MSDVSVIFVTAGNPEEAARIGRTLVEEKLVACANIVPLIRSIYRWKGAIHDEEECLIVMKTRSAFFPLVQERVCALHSYEVPEIIALPITKAFPDYLRWILESTIPEGN